MSVSSGFFLRGAIWTIGAYGLGQGLRLATNIFLARLLAPELFGIMLIVNSLRMGIELISDVGIGQNIVYHKNANDPDFYNTAWTLQAIRSVALWLVAVAVAIPVANFYQSPILAYILPLTAFGIVLSGFTSVSRALLQKRMQIRRLNAFEMIISVISSTGYVLLAYFSPNLWALVFGGLFASAVTMVGSYFLLPGFRERLYLSKSYVLEILHFGKWIFFSSIVYFVSTNFDRLYLAKVVPLDVLGVYGIARSISELVGMVVLRLGNYVLFPLIASQAQTPRAELRSQLAPIRMKFLLVAAIGFSVFAATADLPIRLLYDQRYQAAAWMLPIMIVGSWASMLAVINESLVLGLGKPSYGAFANVSKFAFLLIVLPITVGRYGVLGGVIVIALADLCRYIPIVIGQKREHFSFGRQDLVLTLVCFLAMALWQWIRWMMGFGTSFDFLPLHLIAVIFEPGLQGT